jgi:N-methylhydantoinase B
VLGIRLHEKLAMTAYYCPATGSLLSLDLHEKGTTPQDDIVLDLGALSLRSLLGGWEFEGTFAR